MTRFFIVLLCLTFSLQGGEPYLKKASRSLSELQYSPEDRLNGERIRKVSASARLPSQVLTVLKGLARVDYPVDLEQQYLALLDYRRQYLLTQMIHLLTPPNRMPKEVFARILEESENKPALVSLIDRRKGYLNRMEFIFAECDAYILLLEARVEPLDSHFGQQYRAYAHSVIR